MSMSDNLIEKIMEHPDWLFRLIRNFYPNFSIKNYGIVSRFNDVQEALSRPDVFQVAYAPLMDPVMGAFMLARDNTVYNQRDKGIMRAILMRDDLPEVRQTVKQILDDIIEEHKETKRINIVSEITRTCPVLLTQKYFGFEGASIEQMKKWSFHTEWDMFHNLTKNKKAHNTSIQSGHEMHAHLKALMAKKKIELAEGKEPSNTFEKLISMMMPKSVEFDEERILANVMGLLIGGIEATSQAAVQIINQFFNRPDILESATQAAMANENEKFFKYCWEALRFDPISPGLFRECKQDYTIAKGTLRRKTFKAGTFMFIATRSAMQDGRQVSKPRKFMLDRPAYHYMHFGYGEHTCLGNEISWVQVPEIVKAVIQLPKVRRVSKMEIGDGGLPSKLEIAYD